MSEIKGWFDKLSIEEFLEAALNHDNRVGSVDSYSLLSQLTNRYEQATQSGMEAKYEQAHTHLTKLIRTSKS